jgi:DNA repair protein RadC
MEELFENWNETKAALLDGLDPSKQAVVAPLLENQKNHLINETAAAGSTQAHDIAGFRKIMIPMIRRITY